MMEAHTRTVDSLGTQFLGESNATMDAVCGSDGMVWRQPAGRL